jgi:hypothetical protein
MSSPGSSQAMAFYACSPAPVFVDCGPNEAIILAAFGRAHSYMGTLTHLTTPPPSKNIDRLR